MLLISYLTSYYFLKHDDLYEENLGDEDGNRPAKRRREGHYVGSSDKPDDLEINEDDLFADFGEVEKVRIYNPLCYNKVI